jgi:hypothetical protein
VRAVPASGSVFGGWLINGASYAENPITVQVDEDLTMIAIFDAEAPPPTEYTLTVHAGGASQAFKVSPGAVMPLLAAPADGMLFTSWTVNGVMYAANPLNVTVNADTAATANFGGVS